MRIEITRESQRSIEEVRRQLYELGPGVWYLGMKPALIAAARPVATQSRRNAPVAKPRPKRKIVGTLKNSFRAREGERRFDPSAVVKAAPSAILVTKGTGPRYVRSGRFAGKFVGMVRPNDFVDRAIPATHQLREEKFAASMNRLLPRILDQIKRGNVPRRFRRVLN